MVPQERTRSHKKADSLRATQVAVHVLELREAENYVPNKVLKTIGAPAKASRRLVHLKKLSAAQRAHFDMKKGFAQQGGGPPRVPLVQAELFMGVDPTVVEGLGEGFGGDLLRRLEGMTGMLSTKDFEQVGPDIVAEVGVLLAAITSVI